jgi:hypothetical protein
MLMRINWQSRCPVLRRGDTVISTSGEDGMQGRRGVVESELGDGSFMVKWSGLGTGESRPVQGRFLIRHSSQSHSVRMLNLYLLQVFCSCDFFETCASFYCILRCGRIRFAEDASVSDSNFGRRPFLQRMLVLSMN